MNNMVRWKYYITYYNKEKKYIFYDAYEKNIKNIIGYEKRKIMFIAVKINQKYKKIVATYFVINYFHYKFNNRIGFLYTYLK